MDGIPDLGITRSPDFSHFFPRFCRKPPDPAVDDLILPGPGIAGSPENLPSLKALVWNPDREV
jgi:hypothetical protein